MDQSERIERIKDNMYLDFDEINQLDDAFADRIAALLNHEKIDRYCMVDAYYYDFSTIPRDIQEKLNLWGDCYLTYGITPEGEMVSRWVLRYDLDSQDPIVDGKVMHSDKPYETRHVPEVLQGFDPNLLAYPMPSLFKKL
jgi:hypothetical protein